MNSQAAPANSNNSDVPFEKIHQILGFLTSIGLATVVSGAFVLAAALSGPSDTSVTASSAARDYAILFAWGSACFILGLVFIVAIATLLLYIDHTIRDTLENRDGLAVHKRIARIFMAIFALGLRVAAMFLLGQSLALLSLMMARYGIVGGVLVTALIVILPAHEARNRYFGF